MTQELKVSIALALKARMEGGETQAVIARKTGVSAPYLSHIANQKFEVGTGGKPTTIADHHFRALSQYLGLGKEVFQTEHYMQLMGLLGEAKERGLARIVDGDTGMGKSFVIDEFQRLVPMGTYVVRCTNAMTAPEFVKQIALQTGAGLQTGTKQALLEATAKKLLSEDRPLLIIDEAETMTKKAMSLSLLKDLYVLTNGRVGIVLIGANDFLGKLRIKAQYKSENFPQLLSRFGTNPLLLGGVTPQDATKIAHTYGVKERKTISDLMAQYPNYRELIEALRQRAADQEALNTSITDTE